MMCCIHLNVSWHCPETYIVLIDFTLPTSCCDQILLPADFKMKGKTKQNTTTKLLC